MPLFEIRDKGGMYRVSNYSGGIRGRLDIAMSLIGKPQLIFLVEPTTGLDPEGRVEVWNIIKELANNGIKLGIPDHAVFGGSGTVHALLSSQPVGNNIWVALAWCVGIMLLAYIFAMRVYKKQVKNSIFLFQASQYRCNLGSIKCSKKRTEKYAFSARFLLIFYSRTTTYSGRNQRIIRCAQPLLTFTGFISFRVSLYTAISKWFPSSERVNSIFIPNQPFSHRRSIQSLSPSI